MADRNAQEQRLFITGNEAVALAAMAAGAEALFGYPITPQTEIMEYWVKHTATGSQLFLQTEDELSAGYYTLGAAMAGKKAFTCGLCQMVCLDCAIRIEKK